jgi:hypothetical protein
VDFRLFICGIQDAMKLALHILVGLCLVGCTTAPIQMTAPKEPLVLKPLAEFIQDRPLGVFGLNGLLPYRDDVIVITTNQIFISCEKDGKLNTDAWAREYYRVQLPTISDLALIHFGDNESRVESLLGAPHFFSYDRYPIINLIADDDYKRAHYGWFSAVENQFATMHLIIDFQRTNGFWHVIDVEWDSKGQTMKVVQPATKNIDGQPDNRQVTKDN